MNAKTLSEMRITYDLGSLGDREVMADPIDQFTAWFEEVAATDVIEANAMILTTVSAEGIPEARTVLMKEFDAEGLVIYTNYHSAKARAIAANPVVCALFYWPSLQRQVRWTGVATPVSAEQSDEYFATRPRGSQIGAWSSPQSQPIDSSDVLREQFSAIEAQYPDGVPVPRPEGWGGYRIRPTAIEFWQGRANRLHDRILFTRDNDDSWTITRLAP